MTTLGIDQAARATGRTAQEIRALIESGRIPATRPSGRWLVDQRHLVSVESAQEFQPDFAMPEAAAEAPVPARPPVQGGRPIGADPLAPVIEIKASKLEPAPEPPSDLVSRLEQSAVQIADLRAERDALRLRLREQVSSLQISLDESMQELDAARARVAELEARSYEESVREAGTGARAALTPLFQATTPPPKRNK